MLTFLPFLILVIIGIRMMNKAMSRDVCPFCGGGPLRRVVEETECTQCGKLFERWQARRK